MSITAHEASGTPSNRRTVLDRILMWDQGIVEIEVPLEVRPGSINTDEGMVTFLQFPKTVPDKSKPGGKGMVNFFIHTTDGAFQDCPGTKIVARMQIWRKNLGNRTFLYVDLRPVPDGATATHQFLGVMDQRGHQRDSIPLMKEDCHFFDTPAPLFGTIAVAPLNARTRSTGSSTTGDSALDRLLAAGWKVGSEDDKVVNLFKGEGDSRKTMQHHKPKDKTKKKR